MALLFKKWGIMVALYWGIMMTLRASKWGINVALDTIGRSQAYLIYHFAVIGCMQNKYVCIQKAYNAAGFRPWPISCAR